jgi:hypothetical protein
VKNLLHPKKVEKNIGFSCIIREKCLPLHQVAKMTLRSEFTA